MPSNIDHEWIGEVVGVDTILAWLDPVLPLHDEALPERLRGPLVRLRDNHQGAVEAIDAVLAAWDQPWDLADVPDALADAIRGLRAHATDGGR